ncbi:hypothetical protein [Streptomyces sp.]|uniref:hypothetical protein n=1 Tax=Streptomyces sp. TaxID=1931 RepID=UPI002F958296
MSSDQQNQHHSNRHRDLTYRRYATALVAGVMLAAGSVGGLAIGMDLGKQAVYNACLCLVLVGTIMMTAAFSGTVEVVSQLDDRADENGEKIAKLEGRVDALTDALYHVAGKATVDVDELGKRRSSGGRG